ncbi:MAG: hypothetical protein M3Y39_16075 [Chloroflexota bacterium]|nr:hypothetical protein [Chloroflexota bacterium]
MQQQEMEFSLEKELAEGEELLWFGHPDPSRRATMAGPTLAFIILTSVFGVLGILFLVAALIISFFAIASRATAVVSLVFYIIGGTFLFLAILFGLFATFLRQPLRQTVYGITNQRVIILRRGATLTVDSYTKNDIGHITRRERPDGSGDLIFANARSPYGYNYNSSAYGASYGYGNMSGSGKFTGIPNVRATEQLLRSTFKIEW